MTITIPSGPPVGRSPMSVRPGFEQPRDEYRASETYSNNILGPVSFEMYDLYVSASVANPQLPQQVSPANKAQIIERDETFHLHVKVRFNDSPLTRLLLCLGVDIKTTFSAEGIGGKASEVDLTATIKTEKNKFDYDIVWSGTPASSDMSTGFYAVAAIANIAMSDHPCAPALLGAGYVAAALVQVYDA